MIAITLVVLFVQDASERFYVSFQYVHLSKHLYEPIYINFYNYFGCNIILTDCYIHDSQFISKSVKLMRKIF